MRWLSRSFVYAFLCVLPLCPASGASQNPASTGKPPTKSLEQAIAALRHIRPDQLSEAQKEAKEKELDDAWAVIRQSGKAGVLRLKEEISKIATTNETDDFFKLNASVVIWQISRFDEVESIAAIWNSTPLSAQYTYVFYTAFDAACTQDPRAQPLLRACLRDKKGKVFVALHSLDVAWPLNLDFLWGSFGAKGLPVLKKILETSKESVELQSAIVLLGEAQYLDALPAIRRLATSSDQEVRSFAIRSLGIYGHPQDFEFLIYGLRSKDPKELFSYVFALYEYEDLRAVPFLIPSLRTEDLALRQEVVACLVHLLSAQSFDALHDLCANAPTGQAQKDCADQMSEALTDLPIGLETYTKMSTRAKSELILSIRKSAKAAYSLQDSDARLTRKQLLEVTSDWQKNHRIKSDKLDWVESKHIVAAATAGDLDMLIDVRAALYARLSDECLSEVATLNKIIQWVGRSRYRKAVGLTEKVEAP